MKYSPAVLYYCGDLSLADNPAIAVVGSRDVDAGGLEFTKSLAMRAVKEGFTIVSGGAKGVDSIAETVALDKGGKVISVLSDGMSNRIKAKTTRDAIMRGNLLIFSAVNPDARFIVYSAMDRNKYIYSLSNYAVAVAATDKKGGTWTGAVENLKKALTPLFIRNGVGVPKGNKELIELGGKSITIEDIEQEAINLKELFNRGIEKLSKKEEYQDRKSTRLNSSHH